MKNEVSKWVCINPNKSSITTWGKIYDFVKEIDIDPISNIDFGFTYFIGDDGVSYLVTSNSLNNEFIPLSEWRMNKLNEIL